MDGKSFYVKQIENGIAVFNQMANPKCTAYYKNKSVLIEDNTLFTDLLSRDNEYTIANDLILK